MVRILPCLIVDGEVKLYLWINVTTDFTLLGSTFKRVWIKNDSNPLLWISIDFTNPPCYYNPLQLDTDE